MNARTGQPRAWLSSAEAARRLAADGPNALPDARRRGRFAVVADAAREPMFLLLIGAAMLYLLLGEARESVVLLLMVVLLLGMALYQAGRTERALAALRVLSAPDAVVVRDGRRQRIAAAALVRGDLLVLAEGDRIAGDALVLESNSLAVDESLLTGESVAVDKRAGAVGADAADPGEPVAPGGDGLPWVFAGTMVVRGEGLARVGAIGAHTQLGRIGAALERIVPPPSRLQREMRLLARRLAWLGVGVSLLLTGIVVLRGGGWLEALLAGVALSMSVLPAEFPVVLAVFPALGAWRLTRCHVLTRRLAAIEILGSTSVLCVDKTGTLTENSLTLQRMWCAGTTCDFRSAAPLPAPFHALLDAAVRASRAGSADPIDSALHAAARAGPGSAPLHEYGLTPQWPALVRVYAEGNLVVAFAKGAPETIIALCEPAVRAAALRAAAALAHAGLRVLAVAQARAPDLPLPDDPARLHYRLLGLVALADPVHAGIAAAVADCRRAGVRVLMVTGDHPDTAAAIARQAGLADGAVITGADIERLDGAALAARLDGVSVCARIAPAQKLAIVRALQQRGAVVAMTGDGVNDAPALRAADVGVAMGRRGTEVAREAAELTLLDDRFTSLVEALRAGRRIFDNMRKSMRYVTAVHVPIVALALVPPLCGWPILLFPLHIVFLELVIDPASALGFEYEPAEPDLMQRPPRARDEALLGAPAIAAALLRGLWAALLVLGCFGLAARSLPAPQARATGFAALLLCNLGLLLAQRRQGGAAAALATFNPVFLAIATGALGLLAAVMAVPPLAGLMRFAPPPAPWLAMAAGAALVMLLGLELGRRR